MPYFMGKVYCAIIVSCIALVIMGCGFGSSRQDIPEDIPPLTSEAQALPTPTGEPTLTPANEIVVEPISPLSPIEKPTMPPIQQNVEPIKGSEEALAAAIADLSEQTGIPADEIVLVSMEAMKWSDTSLGCPQEGFMYAQVITPGYLIVLAAQGEQYEYHTDQATNVVLCQEE
jgi:hypothetical protein